MLHCAPQCICRTDLHILWNMQLRSRTRQGPRKCGWVKSRWPRKGGPAVCRTVRTLVLPGTRYTASSQLLQRPVPQVQVGLQTLTRHDWRKNVCGSRAFSVDWCNSDMWVGSLLHHWYLENSVSGSLSEIGLNTSYKARVESVLQWTTWEIWLADRRRAQNFNTETSLEVNYWHVDCLCLGQHLMYLLYIYHIMLHSVMCFGARQCHLQGVSYSTIRFRAHQLAMSTHPNMLVKYGLRIDLVGCHWSVR